MKEHNKTYYSLEELKRARDCYEGYQDGEEVYYFVGALRYACDEIERLNTNLEVANEDLTRIAQLLNLEDGCTIYDVEDKIERLNNIINEIKQYLSKNRVYITGERNLAFELDDILKGVDKE